MAERRYSVRANPQIKQGPMSTMAFRVPTSVRKMFEERVDKLKAADDPGIQNNTDALQDAMVKWVLIEEASELPWGQA